MPRAAPPAMPPAPGHFPARLSLPCKGGVSMLGKIPPARSNDPPHHARHRSHPRQGADPRIGPGGSHRRHLRRPRQPRADAGRRPAAGRSDDDHHRRRELSRLRRRDPGPVADGADAEAGREGRHRVRLRHRHQGRFLQAPVPAHGRFGTQLHRRYGDRRHRRPARGSTCRASRRSRASACRPAPPATGFSSAASGWPWWAAATPRSRRRSTSPTTPSTSP